MKPDLDPLDIEAIERHHAEQLRRTRALYGQRDGDDDLDDPDPAWPVLGALWGAVLIVAIVAAVVVVLQHVKAGL